VKQAAGPNGQSVEYIEATRQDIEVAGRLMKDALGRNPDDLNGVSRALLAQIGNMVAGRFKALRDAGGPNVPLATEIQFTRREIREYTDGLTCV